MKASEALAMSNNSRILPLRERIDREILRTASNTDALSFDNNTITSYFCDFDQYSHATISEVAESLRADGYEVKIAEKKRNENGLTICISWNKV